MMNRTAGFVFAVALAVSLAGCTYRSNLLRSVHEVGVTRNRPASTIGGGEDTQEILWRVYQVDLNPSAVRHLLMYGPTLHLIASDCDGRNEFAWEDIYVGGATLNGSSGERASANLIDAAIRKGGGRLMGISYLRDQDVRDRREFCLEAHGGREIGLGFTSNAVKISSTDTLSSVASKTR